MVAAVDVVPALAGVPKHRTVKTFNSNYRTTTTNGLIIFRYHFSAPLSDDQLSDQLLRKTIGLSIMGLLVSNYRTVDYRPQEKIVDAQL